MQDEGISLPELIRYFNGTASEALRTRIEHFKDRYPAFAEEMEAWQDFIHSFDYLTEALERMWDLHQEWFEEELGNNWQ